MSENRLQFRKYFFVPYNLSPIQKGIQAGHASDQYDSKYKGERELEDFTFWDKTWIILDGGTSNSGKMGHKLGTMEEIRDILFNSMNHFSEFHEPDINDALTGICFLADERVWDFETYPEFYDWLMEQKIESTVSAYTMRQNPAIKRMKPEMQKEMFPGFYADWVTTIGGEKNEILRNLIRGKKLAV
jgi:hypothetical protein